MYSATCVFVYSEKILGKCVMEGKNYIVSENISVDVLGMYDAMQQ